MKRRNNFTTPLYQGYFFFGECDEILTTFQPVLSARLEICRQCLGILSDDPLLELAISPVFPLQEY